MTNEEAIKILKCCIIDKCKDCPLKVENAYACTESSLAPTFVEVPINVLLQVLELLKEQEVFINRLYHEIKAQWNIRRQMPDASGEELKFLVDLLDRMEADEPEPPKEGE